MKISHRLLSSSFTATTALLVTSSVAQAITIRHDVDERYYRNLGSAYSSVGQLSINTLNGSSNCSGTLIESNWVLTAGHCTDNLSSATFSIGQNTYSVNRDVSHSEWLRSRGNPYLGVDIALLRLNTSVTDVLPASLYTGSSEIGEVGTYVGFGQSGNGSTGAWYSDNIKRGAYNVVDATGSTFGWSDSLLVADFDDPAYWNYSLLGSSIPLSLEGSTAPGDSGGALFIDGYLAGVTSFGSDLLNDGELSPNSSYGDLFASTRVSSFIPWIRDVINGQSNISNGNFSSQTGNFDGTSFSLQNSSAQNAETVPESSNIIALLSLIGMLGLLRRR